MNSFLYALRDLISKDNVFYYPYPVGRLWATEDDTMFDTYNDAVNYSVEHGKARVVVRTWSNTTQSWVDSKTYW